MKKIITIMALAIGLGGCSGSDAAPELTPGRMGPTGSRTVTQGGAQDIGYFRSIVEEGGIPRPDTIEPVGFFAEHAVDLPDADCGDSVCTHAMLAVAPGIDRTSNWTMAFLAMNTPVDPRELERPDTHVVLAIEDTTRTALFSASATDAIRNIANELMANDRISVVRIGETPEVIATAIRPTDPALADIPTRFDGTATRAALYDGLARSSTLIEDVSETFTGAHRVLLLTSGVADAGVTDQMRIVGLGEALAMAEVGVSVIGIGDSYRPELAAQISEGGGGSYYFAQTAEDLNEIFTIEGRTSLHPLATDFQIVLEPAPGYRVGRVYGARRAYADETAAYLTSPVLMVGNRTGADDVDEGRRGGGGGLFVELIADPDAGLTAGEPAFIATATWIDAQTGAPVTQTHTVVNQLAPGENPGGMFPSFSDPARGKAFMMLNMYLAIRATVDLYHGGNCAQSLGVPPALEPTYVGWQDEYDDPDIDADWMLLSALTANVGNSCAGVTPEAPEVPMSCFHD